MTKLIKDCLPSSCKVSKEANAAIAKVGPESGLELRIEKLIFTDY